MTGLSASLFGLSFGELDSLSSTSITAPYLPGFSTKFLRARFSGLAGEVYLRLIFLAAVCHVRHPFPM